MADTLPVAHGARLVAWHEPAHSMPSLPLRSQLERLLPLSFALPGDRATGPVAEIFAGAAPPMDADVSVPRFVGAAGPAIDETFEPAVVDVQFADTADVPMPFRGRRIRTRACLRAPLEHVEPNERLLASCDAGALWTVTHVNGFARVRSAFPLPLAAASAGFNAAFGPDRFIELLPLLEFIRAIGCWPHLHAPLRASYIIDDPNLHWPSYGFVDYAHIARQALRHRYHVCFATIPLDTWFTHAATAGLFHTHRTSLSLLVHGNNHARHELARTGQSNASRALLQQALTRIQRLERRTGLEVVRVMVPPHGACSSGMLGALHDTGFEAACISTGSLLAHNPGQAWGATAGFMPSEVIAGCPVLPRWGLGPSAENAMLIAAYLGQAMVLRGHHQDLRHDAEVLEAHANFINSLGDVQWSDMSGIARKNYRWRMEGDTLHVHALGHRLSLDVPPEASRLVIEPLGASDEGGWQVLDERGLAARATAGQAFRLERDTRSIALSRVLQATPQPAMLGTTVLPRWHQSRLILRRMLTEARDRLLPLASP